MWIQLWEKITVKIYQILGYEGTLHFQYGA